MDNNFFFILDGEHPMVMLPEGRHSDSLDSLISPSESFNNVDEKKMANRHHRPNNDDGKQLLL